MFCGRAWGLCRCANCAEANEAEVSSICDVLRGEIEVSSEDLKSNKMGDDQ
jgi:hypothetical protein